MPNLFDPKPPAPPPPPEEKIIPRPLNPLTVAGLIEVLKAYDPDLLVAYQCCSEQVLLEADELAVTDLCLPRPDGWIQNKRPDMETQKYLLFPGN